MLVRASPLLHRLVSKKSYQTALLLASDPESLSNAVSENQLPSFLDVAIETFLALNKSQDAFDFLASVESLTNDMNYNNLIARIIQKTISKTPAAIQRELLSANLTTR